MAGLAAPDKIKKLGQIVKQLRTEASALVGKGGNDANGKSNLQTAKEKLQEADKLNSRLISDTALEKAKLRIGRQNKTTATDAVPSVTEETQEK